MHTPLFYLVTHRAVTEPIKGSSSRLGTFSAQYSIVPDNLMTSVIFFTAYGRIVDPLLKQKSDDLKIKPAITKQGLPAADKPETEKQEKSLFRPSVPKTPLDKAPIPKQFAVAKPVVPPKSSEYNFTLTEDLNSNSTNQPDSPDGHLVCVYQSDDGHSVCFYQSDDGLDRFAVIERMHNEITGCQLFGNR